MEYLKTITMCGSGILLTADASAIVGTAQSSITAIMCAVGGAFAFWGGYEVATGFSQHNAAKQEAGIPKVVGGVAVILLTVKLIPMIFGYLQF